MLVIVLSVYASVLRVMEVASCGWRLAGVVIRLRCCLVDLDIDPFLLHQVFFQPDPGHVDRQLMNDARMILGMLPLSLNDGFDRTGAVVIRVVGFPLSPMLTGCWPGWALAGSGRLK